MNDPSRFAGIDLSGAGRDSTVAIVVEYGPPRAPATDPDTGEKTTPKRRLIVTDLVELAAGLTFEEQLDQLVPWLDGRADQAFPEENGVGWAFVEELRRQLPGKVTGVITAGDAKATYSIRWTMPKPRAVELLVAEASNDRVRVKVKGELADRLRRDLAVYVGTTSADTGKTKYGPASSGGGGSAHGDYVAAMLLAVWAAVRHRDSTMTVHNPAGLPPIRRNNEWWSDADAVVVPTYRDAWGNERSAAGGAVVRPQGGLIDRRIDRRPRKPTN